MLRSPLARCSSPDLRLHQTPESASPTPPRSNSFVSSRRTGIVSEQDVLRLASVAPAADDDRRAADSRLPPWTVNAPSPWPAPVLRQRSNDSEQQRHQPRPLSTGYLPLNNAETQAAQRVQGPASQAVKANGVDTPQVRHQNVALLPSRQLSQQPAEMCWRQWNSAPRP